MYQYTILFQTIQLKSLSNVENNRRKKRYFLHTQSFGPANYSAAFCRKLLFADLLGHTNDILSREQNGIFGQSLDKKQLK